MKPFKLSVALLALSFSLLADENHHAGENHHGEENHHHEEELHHEDEHGHGHHGHGGGKAIGPGKAIVKVDEEKGFALSPEALKTIGVKLAPLKSLKTLIPKNALVVSEASRGVYILRDGHFKMIPAQVLGEEGEFYIVSVNGFQTGDQIALKGAGILRVSDIYSTDKSEYGHAH